MKYFLSVCLLMATYCCTAQPPFADSKNIHTRTILNGKATIFIPDDYSYSRPFWADDDQFTDAALYQTAEKKAGFACNLFRKPGNQEELYRSYNETKEANTNPYIEVLRDEFIRKGENSYFIYSFRLKDEFYRNDGRAIETSEGIVLINYVCFYWVLQNSIASQIVFDYKDKIEALPEFQQLVQKIIDSYHLND